MGFGARAVIVAAVFGVQAAGIVYARFVPTRYVCWAPYDQISFFRVDARRADRPLSADDVARRYRLPSTGRENRSIHHVLHAIAQYESTYGRRDPVSVTVRYRVNRGPEQAWTHPQ